MTSRALLLFVAAWPLVATASPDTPSIAPPTGAHFALTLAARGVQVYECRGQAWAFVMPKAVLLEAQGCEIGPHGAGPHWQLGDGSRLDTSGCLAPAGACLNLQSIRVAYTANYLFFNSAP